MNFNFRELVAEFFGTACLIFVGCGSVVIGGFGADLPLGAMPIALSFGLCLTFLIYAIGPISGCHLNPAASLGLWAAKLFPGDKILGYAVAQILGATAGAFLLVLIAEDKASGYDVAISGLGQNGWGPGYLGEFGTLSAFATEVIATFIFMIAILGAVKNEKAGPFAGLSIGLALTAIILVFLNVTGVSLNPARSIGPAIFVGGEAIKDVWLFIVAPSVGALAAGSFFSWIRE